VRRKYRKQLFFCLAGAIAGYSLYRWIGCHPGACPLWGSPVFVTLWGTAAGAILGWTPGSGDL
jgi:hypothetical protein